MTPRLPTRWRQVKLGTCCQIVSGSTPRRDRPKYWGGEIPWATPRDLSGLDGTVLSHTAERITDAGYRSCPTTLLPAGAVLFTSRAPIGLVAIAGVPVCTNQGFKSLVPGPDVDSGYLYWCIRHHAPGIAARGSGSTFAEVSKEVVSRFQIPLPPLPEQRRIAAALDKADAIRRKRRESLRLLDELLRSAFLEMFGDPVRNEKGWERRRLADIGLITTGNTPSRARPEYYGDEIEWIKSDNINTPQHYVTRAEECLSAEGRKFARTVGPGAILVTCIAGSRDAIGKVAMTDRDVAFNQQINAVEPGEDVDHRFLYTQVFVAQELVQRASTNSMKGMVSKNRLASIRAIDPPTALQRKFGDWFTKWHVARQRTSAAMQSSVALFESLAQRAFRGEL